MLLLWISNEHGTIRVVVRLSASLEETALRLHGKDGMGVGKFIENDEDRYFFSTVPLDNATFDQAMALAKFHGLNAWGVSPLKRGGWETRVQTPEFEL